MSMLLVGGSVVMEKMSASLSLSAATIVARVNPAATDSALDTGVVAVKENLKI